MNEEPTTNLENSAAIPVNAEEPTTNLENSVATPAKAEEPTQKSGFAKFFKIISIIIWSLVILLVLIPLLGRSIINQALGAELTPSYSIEIAQPTIALGGKEIVFKTALDKSYKSAEKYAANKLDRWEEDLIKRIDTDFLDWYFNYFNQRGQELSIFFKYLGENFINGFNSNIVNEKLAKDINENIKREFAKRVLQANSAEVKFKTIVIDTTQFYIQELSTEVGNVPKMYKIFKPDWDKYLETIKVRLENEQGDGVSVVTFIGAYGGVKIASKFAAMAGGKAVAVVSAKLGSMIDPAIALTLIALDYWDYTNGVKENRPRLREDLVNCLHDIKISLLSDPEHGVMAGINELEEKITNSVLQSNFSS